MPLRTKFVNKTKVAFRLKEGNAGVYRELGTLPGLANPAHEPSTITEDFDEKSTYKEFRVAAITKGQRFTRLITSDFILDNAVINIVPDPLNSESFDVQGEPRVNRPREPFSLLARLLSAFGMRHPNP